MRNLGQFMLLLLLSCFAGTAHADGEGFNGFTPKVIGNMMRHAGRKAQHARVRPPPFHTHTHSLTHTPPPPPTSNPAPAGGKTWYMAGYPGAFCCDGHGPVINLACTAAAR